jgi:hypothetical protein
MKTEGRKMDEKEKEWGIGKSVNFFGIVFLCLQSGIRKPGGQIKHYFIYLSDFAASSTGHSSRYATASTH